MTIENYLIIDQNNVVTNIVLWDGNINTWQPPEGCLWEINSQTIAYIWEVPDPEQSKEVVLIPVLGASDIGFIWNPTDKTTTTNKPKPPTPPQTLGLQSV
jgi:hypothetical protein